jgi:hypothetical protein
MCSKPWIFVTLSHELHSLQPDSLAWNTSQNMDCSYAHPHLSQREAKSPDRIGQPFFHSPDVEAAPHSAFMQTFIDSIIDQLSGSIQLSITSNEARALSYSPHDGALIHRNFPQKRQKKMSNILSRNSIRSFCERLYTNKNI